MEAGEVLVWVSEVSEVRVNRLPVAAGVAAGEIRV
jgi:hypothetical protein